MSSCREVREMRTAETVLHIIRDRGQRGLPVERLYRLLYNRNLYLRAYGKLYSNKGAMTPGVTPETVDAPKACHWQRLIPLLRNYATNGIDGHQCEGYAEGVPKRNGQRRALGMPTWSDKLLQEVIRSLLEAYYEPQFSHNSHGFRPGRGCHTALQEIQQRWRGVKWFIEGDIRACFDTINHTTLLSIMREQIHDNRFIRLISHLLEAGYMEEWYYGRTYSGVPQGGVLSPLLSNLVLDRLDKYVEETLIPANTRGRRRRRNRPYGTLMTAAYNARQVGDLERARRLNQQAQTMPSRDPNDPHFRRLGYLRYADDFILGFTGPKVEAQQIKLQLADFLRTHLTLELNDEKTLITHARDERALFLGYAIHTLHADDKHDDRGQRSINGGIGLRVPRHVIQRQCRKYMHRGKPWHLMVRTHDSIFGIVAQYQAEYRGVMQYYRRAYNLHQLSRLKWVAETSLVKTLARKLNISGAQVYRRYQSTHQTEHGTYKVLEVVVDRGPEKAPLTTRFGGIPLRWSRWATINDSITAPNWSGRSELVERLLAQQCALCGAAENIEVHHIRKLADLNQPGQTEKPKWVETMASRRRKSLIVCRPCHHDIHAGRYDGPALS